MLIQDTSITVMYKKIEKIKKVYYNNENILRDYFNEATVLPIPDTAPLEIPRIIIETLHGHAQLNISPVATTFQINYNDGFETDWKKCSMYIQKRMSKVFDFLNLLTNNDYEYIGLVSNVIYNEVNHDGVKKLSETLLNSKNIKGIYDINIKYTFTENDNMFINIMLQNARMFNKDFIHNTDNIAGSFSIAEQIAESIGAIIDINDRYGFNNIKNYKSDRKQLDVLLETMSNIINNKLRTLIEEGVY